MATTQTSFKNARSRRIMQVENGYQLGCYYTNQEIPQGFAKLLVNYDYADDGRVLKPRMGITNDAVLKHSNVDTASNEIITLGDATIDGLLYFKDLNERGQLAECILSFGNTYLFGSDDLGIQQGRYYNPNIDNVQNGFVSRGSSGWSLVLDKRNANKYTENPYVLGTFKKDSASVNSVGFIRTKNFSNIDIFNAGLNSFFIDRPVVTNFNGSIYTICTSGVTQFDTNITCADPNFKLSLLEVKEEKDANNETTFTVYRKPVEINKPSLSEAASVGFNMLSDEPYEFPNKSGATDVTGMIAYKPNEDPNDPFGEVLFTANTGEKIRFNAVYSFEAGKTYQVKWEYKGDGDENWTLLKDWTAVPEVGIDKYIYYDVIPDHVKFSIQVTIRVGDDDATARLGIYPLFTLNVDQLKNLGTEVFDLSTATGMFTQNNMLGLYGVQGAETSIFFSDIENPGYFPFPHNMDSYDEYVLKVINYLDQLLVVTTSSIYSITGKGLPSTFVKKKLVTNLNITELDADLIKVIKDQVFFKADNTFFVLKPNTYTGDATDLRAYEVSKSINTFLQNFERNTLDMFNKVYPLRLTEPSLVENPDVLDLWLYNKLDITGYNQHVVDGRLHIVVRLKLVCDDTPNVEEQRHFENEADLTIIYDTLTKQWYFHTHSIMRTDAIRHRRIDNQNLLYFDNFIKDGIRYLLIAKNTTDPRDYYDYIVNTESSSSTVQVNPKLPNWQFIDTGIVAATNNLYKRLREFQFTVDNTSQDHLNFYATIYADGKNILDAVSYEMQHNLNPSDENYGHLYMTVVDTVNLEFEGTTKFDNWEVDFSKFPQLNLLRNHVLLAGKGRFISGEFINRDEKKYELSNLIWVYRIMNGR